MTNKFYGIGVGVGDPEEITIKAINTLKKLDVVILPEAKKMMVVSLMKLQNNI